MATSTQQFIDIAGIKDGIIILKNGGYRIIMQIGAINFALKSEQEQNSLVFQFQSFLNSLHFPIEIVVRSKRLDLVPYLKKIGETAASSQNELITALSKDYVGFVAQLINVANIMKKSFYVVIPYEPINVSKLNIFQSLFEKSQNFEGIKISETDFKSQTDQLLQRANIAASGLGGMGLHCLQLSTEEVIDLFYQVYNPDEAGKERIDNIDALSSTVVVSKGEVDLKPEIPANAQDIERIDNTDLVKEQQKRQADAQRQAVARGQAINQAQPEMTTETPADNRGQETPPVSSQPQTDDAVPPDNNTPQNG